MTFGVCIYVPTLVLHAFDVHVNPLHRIVEESYIHIEGTEMLHSREVL